MDRKEHGNEVGMGLRINVLELIGEARPFLPPTPVCYMMGTEDCRFTYGQVIRKYNRRSTEFASNHNRNDLCDLDTAFRIIGFNKTVTVDMNERADIRVDLTASIPEEHCEKADLVCELGTLEHIFDVKAAIVNMNQFVRKGGAIFHMSPVSSYRHGFINFNPSFFNSLYSGSGYKLIFWTMNVSFYNPFYIINIEVLPKPLRVFFSTTNEVFRILRLRVFNFNLPLQHDIKGSRFMKFLEFLMMHLGPPKHLYYCCAYQKLSDELKIPYDIWD